MTPGPPPAATARQLLSSTGRALAGYWPWLLFAAFAAVPFLPGKEAALYAQQFTPLFVYAVLALGLNVVIGQAGIFHLGIAAFFGIGAYTAGILIVRQFPFQQSFVVAAGAAALAAAAAGVLTTAPILRLRGDYLALVTMGFGLIAVDVLKNLENITNGTKGINPVSPRLLPGVDDPDLAGLKFRPSWRPRWRDYPHFYFLCLALLAVVYAGLGALERSRLGRAWVALREDELAAACMGLSPARLKLSAIALGAGLAGLAGALYAVHFNGTTEPGTYDFNLSMILICCLILGGLGSRPGVVLGVILLLGFQQILTPDLDNWLQKSHVQEQMPDFLRGKENARLGAWKLGIFGAVLILMMRFRPAGLVPEARHKHELNPDEGTPRPEGSRSPLTVAPPAAGPTPPTPN